MKHTSLSEQAFLQKLQNRAQEQEKLLKSIPFPHAFRTISIWFGNHPWRIMVPIALVISFLFHFFFKQAYDDFILKIFGGFGIIKL